MFVFFFKWRCLPSYEFDGLEVFPILIILDFLHVITNKYTVLNQKVSFLLQF